METDVPAASVPAATPSKDPDCPAGIVIHDGRSEEDLTRIGTQLKEKQALDITAGCAGLILNPIGESASGTVLIKGTAGDHTLSLLSKSGGFGGEDILIDLANQLLF